jgi:hypothetical protein
MVSALRTRRPASDLRTRRDDTLRVPPTSGEIVAPDRSFPDDTRLFYIDTHADEVIARALEARDALLQDDRESKTIGVLLQAARDLVLVRVAVLIAWHPEPGSALDERGLKSASES